MSKITFALLLFLCIFLGILVYTAYGPKNNAIINSLSAPIRSFVAPVSTTSLSFTTNVHSILPGQTVNLAVIIHNSDPHPALAQLEISYNPTLLTVDSLTPGPFFTNPTIALQNIDPTTGRISYALRCPNLDSSVNAANDCVDITSSTVAIITVTTNPYAFKGTTTLSFLPKTVIRTSDGRDILHSTTGLDLTIGNSVYPVSSESAIASPGANFIRIH